ncbi:MAG: 5-oxoprolinase subunit B family protein [Cognatishimia sp.]
MTDLGIHSAPEIMRFGSNAIIVRFGIQVSAGAVDAVRALGYAIETAEFPWVTQSAASLTSVMIEFDTEKITPLRAQSIVEGFVSQQNWLMAKRKKATRRWHIPVSFGGCFGPELAEAAGLADVCETQAITELTGADIEVLTIGFAPGQPYLGLLPEHWNMPRRRSINPRVPAGSLVAAVRQLVLFNSDSATGWRHVGQTGFRPFKSDRLDPIVLQAGDAVRFHAISPTELQDLLVNNPQGLGGAWCEILE